jgi:hemerythrin superfamily protein
MNAIDLLKEQHDEVDELIAMLEKSSDENERGEVFAELADKLAAHATIEEHIFYPAVMKAQASTEEILLESVEEHLAIKRVLADLLELEASDPQFDAKISVMKEQIEHHARKEEEKELFPKVKKLFDADQLEAMGQQMEALFHELLEDEPRLDVPAETAEAAPIS